MGMSTEQRLNFLALLIKASTLSMSEAFEKPLREGEQ